jgi:hypothetical protein
MFALIAAMAAATQTPAPAVEYRDDLNCMLAMAIVLGAQEETPESKDNQDGLIGLVMYYVGKIEAKAPNIDYIAEIKTTLADPDYMTKRFPVDANRCADEAGSKGEKLQKIGDALTSFGETHGSHQH